MSGALTPAKIEAAFVAASEAELNALKPGNVHRYSPGHGMDIGHFKRAALAAAPSIANANLPIGLRILRATEASVGATGTNVNLGIVLLSAPLAKAAAEIDAAMGLRRRLAIVLSLLGQDDADHAFAAIRLANPAGLGSVDQADVKTASPGLTLIEAMHLASTRDRIARAYVTAYEDIFDVALPALHQARGLTRHEPDAITMLHMTLLSEFPDSHIARKFGAATADLVRDEARALRPVWMGGASPQGTEKLLAFDADLKARGLNPGTTADFVVATLFSDQLSRQSHAQRGEVSY